MGRYASIIFDPSIKAASRKRRVSEATLYLGMEGEMFSWRLDPFLFLPSSVNAMVDFLFHNSSCSVAAIDTRSPVVTPPVFENRRVIVFLENLKTGKVSLRLF